MKDFRITFNKPAVKLMGDNDVQNLKVRLEGGIVFFRPVRGREQDTIEVSGRTRGGGEAVVEGRFAEDLFRALTNRHGPFFTLRSENGWFVATPYPSHAAPSKFAPHLRVWVPKAAATHATAVPELYPMSLADSLKSARLALQRDPESIRHAKALIDRYNADRKPGRPSREVMEAKTILAEFTSLTECLPGLKLVLDMSLLTKTDDRLDDSRSFQPVGEADNDVEEEVANDVTERRMKWRGRAQRRRHAGAHHPH